jgi:4-amino-4-deoxychorismate lyase
MMRPAVSLIRPSGAPRAELQARGAPEGLMSDTAGRIIGATMANVFLVKNGALLTPQLDCCGVHGIMRALVLELAALSGIRALETAIDKDTVASADEIFLTNALTGLRPVRRCAGRELALGPVTRRLAAALRAHGVEEALE